MTYYANITDYRRLYSPAYFGKTTGVSSFTPDAFSKEILAFCAARSVRHVVDVGSGSGALAKLLRAAGIRVITCDFEPATDDGIHLDLAGSPEEAAKVLDNIQLRTEGEPWLTTCLDVLEHIDIEDVCTAIQNLRTVCCDKGLLIASISTRPSSADNKFHATILPKSTWLEILRTLGFTVNAETIFGSARAVRREYPEADGLRLVSYWAKCDLFRDIDHGEPDYVLLSAIDVEANAKETRRERVELLLDISYRRAKREQFNEAFKAAGDCNGPIPRIGLNIHATQEFNLYRPLLDVLPREAVVVLVRVSVFDFDPDALSVMRGFFARCGVNAIFYERCDEIDWQEIGLTFLFTGVESTVNKWHVLGRQVVEAAKLNGVHTIQMQHGIWIEQFPQRLIDFGSETIWAWSNSYERFIQASYVELASKAIKAQGKPWQRYQLVGSPKFVDMRSTAPQDLLRWRLGVDVSRYKAVALIGTNLHWHHHGTDSQTVRERLVRMMRSVPDVFFVVKLHPHERASDATELIQPNTLVLNDVLMGILDLHMSRLVAAVDIVISSLSTLLLDAAVAGKPCVQYDTGNDLSYDEVSSVQVEELPMLLSNISALAVNQAFIGAYGEAADQPFYAHLAKLLAGSKPSVSDAMRQATEVQAASHYSTACEVETLVGESQSLRDLVTAQTGRADNAEADARQAIVRAATAEADAVQASARAAAAEADVVQAGARAAAAEADAVQAGARAAAAEADAARATAQAAAAEADAAQATARAAVAEADATQARNELGMLQNELGRLYSSRSWRLTAPYRYLGRPLKRFLR